MVEQSRRQKVEFRRQGRAERYCCRIVSDRSMTGKTDRARPRCKLLVKRLCGCATGASAWTPNATGGFVLDLETIAAEQFVGPLACQQHLDAVLPTALRQSEYARCGCHASRRFPDTRPSLARDRETGSCRAARGAIRRQRGVPVRSASSASLLAKLRIHDIGVKTRAGSASPGR